MSFAGLNIAASGMLAQQQRLDVVAGNVANADTDGYRAVRTGLQALPGPAGSTGAAVGAGVAAVGLGREAQQGPLQQTDRPLDVAIAGSGYLQVRQPNGQVALTRAGDLQLDRTGRLVTAGGEPLVPPVQVPPGTDPGQIAIAPNGAVSAQGRAAGRIQLVDVPAPDGLLALGGGLLAPTTASGRPSAAPQATLQQGALEGSDVDLAGAMVDLLETKDSFGASVAAARAQDETLAATLGLRR